MFTVYILYSFAHKKTYTGCTSDLIQRFHSHNIYSNTDWTRNFRPWVVVFVELFDTKSEALIREKELKSGKGRDWVQVNLSGWLSVFNLAT
jgi:putative endonuclease